MWDRWTSLFPLSFLWLQRFNFFWKTCMIDTHSCTIIPLRVPMAAFPKWQYDEFNPPGADYSDPNIVAAYDAFHLRFRNYKESAEKILGSLGLGAEHTVIDMGCGTGAFTLHAAPHCKKIYAVDISAPMLDYVKTQAEQKNLQNIEYHHAGFLTYDHQDALADAA
ncbi:methyltransferase domain-containing protein, partial [bacterium]|nr:methyltransferase domain-containing protein [bacterium]